MSTREELYKKHYEIADGELDSDKPPILPYTDVKNMAKLNTKLTIQFAIKLFKQCDYFDSYSVENIIEELEKELFLIDNPIIEEETIPVTLATIKAICGWSNYCDVTGANHYMLKEYSVDDREIFDVRESHAKELGLI